MQKYSQYCAEAIIPLLGYYYWNWGWYFILLFIILDAVAKEAVLHLKSKKIYETQGGGEALSIWKKEGIKSAAMSLIVLFMLHGMYYMSHINVDFSSELYSFFSYKEMGIAQGWVLVPLVFLNVWAQYKFTFLKLGLHTKTQLSQLWLQHVKYKIFILILVVVGALIHTLIHLDDLLFVWILVLLPFIYMVITRRKA